MNTSHATVGIAIFIVLTGLAITPFLSPNGDNASYILLSDSLLSGKGYTNTDYPGEPAETQYPPLLPFLLMPILAVFGQNYFVMKIIALVFGALGLKVMFRYLQEISSNETAWIATLLTAVNATYIFFASSILTETLYVFLSGCVLIKVSELYKSEKDSLAPILFCAILIALSFYARTIGATLALSMCGFLFLKKRYKAAILLATFTGLLLLPWALRSIEIRNSYFDQLTEESAGETDVGSLIVIYRLAQNIPRYVGKSFIDLLGGPAIADLPPYTPAKVLSSIFLSALLLYGYLGSFIKRGLTLENTYLFVYIGILLVWPYHDARFLLPILPLLVFYLIDGLDNFPTMSERFRIRFQTTIVGALLILGVGSSCHLIYQNRTDYYSPEMSHFKEACLWLKSNSQPDALIISRKPRLSALWSDRKAWWYTDAKRIPQKDQLGNPIAVTHIIVTEFPISGVNLGEGFQEMQEKYPNKFTLLYRTPEPTVSIYSHRTP